MKKLFLILALGYVVLSGIGCATTESENLSARPWNAPHGWENGLPSSFYEGR
jgi:hypothetical protein